MTEKTTGRKASFVLAVGETIKPVRPGTLRAAVVDVLREGAMFEDVVAKVREFDAERQLPEKNVERRAYEVIRLLHYHVGYGLRQDEDGRIFLVEA